MEQEQISSIPAEGDKNTETSYGKFKSAEELLKAYNALEGEFTKRSQRLKELESKREGVIGKAKDFTEKYPIAEIYAEEVAEEVAKAEMHENTVLENALIKVLSRKIKTPDQMAKDETVIGKVLSEESNKDFVINEYLEKIRERQAPVAMPSGEMPILRPYKPSTIKEAGELAKILIQKL